ncbi:hypothetical protein BRADI_4g07985v3 [Brachypodium distachyon]|uniref:Uncharacterized protein n=1 Tax=Brachypodium distachyon TaxID=15368 RepID=A0A0Q3HEV6_BRADI|nr:hypothetical protein BRADI_4g07985v3 [Brachypodium distachyon]
MATHVITLTTWRWVQIPVLYKLKRQCCYLC